MLDEVVITDEVVGEVVLVVGEVVLVVGEVVLVVLVVWLIGHSEQKKAPPLCTPVGQHVALKSFGHITKSISRLTVKAPLIVLPHPVTTVVYVPL